VSLKILRKFVLCAANIILFPELHTQFTGKDVTSEDTDDLHTREWIDDLVPKTSPVYRDYETSNRHWSLEQLILQTNKYKFKQN